MKQRDTYVLAILTLLAVLTGCEEKLPRNELPEFVQRIVVNGILSNDSTMNMEISSSGSPYRADIRPEILDDAIVILQVNDADVSVSYNAITRRYESPVTVNAGDKVHVAVSHPDILSAAATVFMPPNLAFFSTSLVPEGGLDINDLPSDRLDITILDDPAKRNYYNVRFFYYNELEDLFQPFEFPVTDASLLANSTFKLDDGTFVIKDDLFHGKRKTISVVAPRGLVVNNTDIKYLVQVVSLSEAYWQYLESLNRYNNEFSGSGLFNSGVIVQSNISGGLGILGTQLVESDTIR